MDRSILFVDDEKQILKAIRREFMDSGYRTFFACDAQEALETLDSNEIDLIVTDMRMPVMDGCELLKLVREKHPSIKRVVLSGYADENLVNSSLSEGLAEFYIFKPWGSMEIITSIEMALGEVYYER